MTEDKKDANGGLASQPRQRKTLKLKSPQEGKKRLGPSVSANASAQSKPSTRGGTVVVVTKSKPSNVATNESSQDSLNDPEIRRKLDILKNASQNRAGVSASNEIQSDEVESDSENEELKPEKQEVEVEEKVIVEDVPVAESTKEIKQEPISDAKKNRDRYRSNSSFENVGRSNGKIRNLDSLGRKKPKKEDEEAAKVELEQNKSNSSTSQQIDTPGKNEAHLKVRGNAKHGNYAAALQDEEGEQVSASKKRGNKNKGEKDRDGGKKLSVAELLRLGEESAEEAFKPRGIRSIRAYKSRGKSSFNKVEREKLVKTVLIYEGITVQEIASAMSEKVGHVIKKLMSLGIMATINQSLDIETSEILVGEMGHIASIDNSSNLEESLVSKIISDEGKGYETTKRPPIVTIMGHVDHGKTSLLDAYRNARVVDGEAGGITQHIAAYQVDYNGGKITFLDTPGHAAFTEMRLRGAMVTDIVVIIIAADDGVMEQTIEAINHAKAAEVPIIVAINKIDKPEANPEKVKNQLLSYNLIPEDMGGDVMVVQISAAKKLNLEELLDAISLQSEIINLEVANNRPAVGSVVESRMEKLHGVTTTLLLKKGTLKLGDIIVAGKSWGRVKNIYNDLGKGVKSATASMPVEVIGLNATAVAGDEFFVVEHERQAREIIEYRITHANSEKSAKRSITTLESMMKGVSNKELRQLNVLIKADVHGSMEAIAASLHQIATDEVKVNIVHQAVGGITESDVTLARASDAIIIGFNVRAPGSVTQVAKVHGIEVRYYSIIYQLIDDVKLAASGLLDPIQKEEITGYAEIRDIFNMSKFGKVAGCYITGGFITRDCKLRVIRDDIVIYSGDIKALKRFKDDVKEVKSGFECGISLEKFEDIKVGDRLEAFIIKEEKRTL